MRTLILLSVCLCTVWAKSDSVRSSLTTEDIATLVKAGFGEPLIVNVIESSGVRFDSEQEAEARLRKAGVGESILTAIRSTDESAAPRLPLLDPGVYVKRSDAYALVPAELVQWRGAASTLRVADVNFTRISMTAVTERRNSPLVVSGNVELLIVCDSNESAADYRIIRGEAKDETREFHAEAALRDGVLLGIGATSPHAVPMRVDRGFDLGVRFFFTSLPKGEYAVLRSNVVSGGKLIPAGVVYSFSVE